MRPLPLFLLIGALATGLRPAAAQQIDTLTLERAVGLALQHQPSLHGAEAGRAGGGGRIAPGYGGIPPGGGVHRIGHAHRGDGSCQPGDPPHRTVVQQLLRRALRGHSQIWDFGKTSGRVSQTGYLSDAAQGDYASAREILAVNTEVAYVAFLQARRVVAVNEEALASTSHHLAQARAFFVTGRRPQLDVTKAEVDSLNANVNLIQARNAFRLAKLQLENTMGVHPPNEYAVVDSFTLPVTFTSLPEARTAALRNRPEIAAAQARLESGRAGVTRGMGPAPPDDRSLRRIYVGRVRVSSFQPVECGGDIHAPDIPGVCARCGGRTGGGEQGHRTIKSRRPDRKRHA